MVQVPIALAGAIALLAGIACGGAQPVSPADCRPTPATRQGSLLVMVADPPESSIRAVLPGTATATAGRPYAVRLLADARKASGQARFQSARQGTSQVYQQTIAGAVSGQLAEFQTTLVFPVAGCWDAEVSTGTAAGSMTFRVA
ncbi:MAG TPA: hypothetical protein VGO86_03140 [Candidatus Dormibacteraeota bacterium]